MKQLILPIGSREQHGPHLPLETDSLLAQRIANELGRKINAGILEVIDVSLSEEHSDFPGTETFSKDEFKKSLLNSIQNYLKLCDQLIIFNAHGGNSSTLAKIQCNFPNLIILNLFDIIKSHLVSVRESKLGGICHAGEFETSLMMFLFPSLVEIEKITPEIVTYVPELDPDHIGLPLQDWKTIDFSTSGVIGDPTKANEVKGEVWFQKIVLECINRIKSSHREYLSR